MSRWMLYAGHIIRLEQVCCVIPYRNKNCELFFNFEVMFAVLIRILDGFYISFWWCADDWYG